MPAHSLGPIDDPTADALLALGAVLRRLRGNRGLSQRALAGRSGLSQSTISRLENGLAPGVRVGWLARLLAGLDRGLVAQGHEPWNAWTAPGWALLLERFSLHGRLAERLKVEQQRVLERTKGGQPYRKRPPIENPSEAYLEAVELSNSIARYQQYWLAGEQEAQAQLAKAELDDLLDHAASGVPRGTPPTVRRDAVTRISGRRTSCGRTGRRA